MGVYCALCLRVCVHVCKRLGIQQGLAWNIQSTLDEGSCWLPVLFP